MRIALLNLPLDSNYGGNLQRYALMRVLSDMGHDVIHLNTHFVSHTSVLSKVCWWIKQLVKKCKQGKSVTLSRKAFLVEDDRIRCEVAMPFYEQYSRHTPVISTKSELYNCKDDFDAFVVGSDQVWRKSMTKSYGLMTYFFDFIPADNPVKRIAYAASMGTDVDELTEKEIAKLRNLYQHFTSVSVREESALHLLHNYGCRSPQARVVLDPTMLLNREDYEKMTENTHMSEGNMFCYILDPDEEKQSIITYIQKKEGLNPFYNIDSRTLQPFSIEQWLRSFMDAKMVVTDSYHGFVFSLIFQRPVRVILNKRRGNSRFTSLASMLSVDLNNIIYNSDRLNQCMENFREESIAFLKESLN